MGVFSSIGKVLSGGFVEEAFAAVKEYFPPDLSPEQQANIKLSLENLAIKKQAQIDKAADEAERNLNDRIAKHEGTAKDLLSLPIIGRVVIFARGCQRPLWGFFTMYADLMWFGGDWGVLTDLQGKALLIINFLVLGFLFGERAIKNVMPLVDQYFGKK
ncbi:hypothetical protein NVP1151O_43 [Vibrio phage 1.151.O._10N.222.46.B1]|nr:hypothetical protein NVP1151O_43 [Vibrio phage 1.151.O._10N.222.46.B1]